MSTDPRSDDRLIAWLYGELSESEAARFEAELEANPELRAEAEGYQSVRELARERSELDPPASMSAFLMHAAAREVAKPAARRDRRGGWLSSLFGGLASRPALAAAAALVGVVGIAGALYSTGGFEAADKAEAPAEMASGGLDGEEEEPVDSPAAAAAPALADMEGGAPADQAPVGRAKGIEQDDALEQQAFARQAEPRLRGDLNSERKKMELGKNAKPKALKESGEDRYGALASSADRKAVAEKSKRVVVARDKDDAAGPPPPPSDVPAPEPVALTPTTNAVSSSDYLDREAKPSAPGSAQPAVPFRPYQRRAQDDKWAKDTAGKLSASVKAKDCQAAARIANDILDRNPEYYAENLANSSDIKKCQMYVSAESKRRTELRSKKGGGSGTGTAAPARKAPAKSRAEEAAADSAEAY